MKRVLILSITIILMLSMTVGCGNKKDNIKDDNVKVNTNEGITKDRKIGVFTFKNTSLVYENNTSKLMTLVTNTSENTEYLKEFKIHVKDESGNDIVVLPGYVGSSIDAKSSITISSSYASDLTDAASIEYEITR